jgi:hypothetical protein
MAIDTLKVAKRLREVRFSAVIAAVQEATEGVNPATKMDIAELRTAIREAQLRLEAKIDAVKADILTATSD